MDEKQFFSVGEIKEIGTADIVGWASRPMIDRDGDVVHPSAWGGKNWDGLKNFMKNPVLMLSHDWSKPPVGTVQWVKNTDEGLVFKAKFANTPIGQELKQLYKDGVMRAFSVGFQGKKSIDPKVEKGFEEYSDASRVFTQAELFEISCVSIPACPEALVEYARSGKIQSAELKSLMNTITDIKEESPVEEADEKFAEIEEKGWDDMPNEIRHRMREPELFEENSFRIIPIKRDKPRVNAVAGRLKGETTMTLQSLRFPKEDGWTMAEAKDWVKAHPDVGKSLDIDEIELKAGRAISRANMEIIREAINILGRLVEEIQPEQPDEVEEDGCKPPKEEEEEKMVSILDQIEKPGEVLVDIDNLEKPSREFDIDQIERDEALIEEIKRVEKAKRLGKAFA